MSNDTKIDRQETERKSSPEKSRIPYLTEDCAKKVSDIVENSHP